MPALNLNRLIVTFITCLAAVGPAYESYAFLQPASNFLNSSWGEEQQLKIHHCTLQQFEFKVMFWDQLLRLSTYFRHNPGNVIFNLPSVKHNTGEAAASAHSSKDKDGGRWKG